MLISLFALSACAAPSSATRADVAALSAGLSGQELMLEQTLIDTLVARGLDRCDCDWLLDAEARELGTLAAGPGAGGSSDVRTVLEATCSDNDERFEHSDRVTYDSSAGAAGRRDSERAAVERAIRMLVTRATVVMRPRCPLELDGDA